MEAKKKFLMPVAVHPGALVKDWMEEKGVADAELAALGGIPETSVRRIVEGREDITLAVAAALERATDISADFWMRVQKGYEEDWVRLTREKGAKAIRLTGVQGLEAKQARSARRHSAELAPAGVRPGESRNDPRIGPKTEFKPAAALVLG